MSNSTISQSFSYSVFTFVTDEIRGSSVPVGVVLWGSHLEQVRVRFAADDEKIKGLKGTSYMYLRVVESQIDQWLKSGIIPYAESKLSPHSDAWWKHLSSLLVHSVRLSKPKAIDCRNLDEEVELLYEAVVTPERGSPERTERIDRVLTRSLGRQLTRKLQRGTIPGFGGRPVPVRHFKTSSDKVVVIEGVNLAAAAAEDDTDALVSKLQRIRAANGNGASEKTLKAFVGYLSSPQGLNGEAALVDWIKEKAGAETFDLLREHQEFQGSIERVVDSMEDAKKQPPISGHGNSALDS